MPSLPTIWRKAGTLPTRVLARPWSAGLHTVERRSAYIAPLRPRR